MSECTLCNHEPLGEWRVIHELESSYIYITPYQKKFPARVFVSLKSHKEELFDLEEKELLSFMKDCAHVAKALKKSFKCDKVNYAIAGDGVRHMHMHVVGKQEGGSMWANLFTTQTDGEEKISDSELEEMVSKLKSNL